MANKMPIVWKKYSIIELVNFKAYSLNMVFGDIFRKEFKKYQIIT